MTDTGEVAVNHSVSSFASETLTYQTMHPEHIYGTEVSSLKSEQRGLSPQSNTQGQEIPPQSDQQSHEAEAEAPVIDIVINNVVCSFSTRCHLNLKKIAMEGLNVMYRRENGMVSMKLRRPYTTASIWSSGKITCTGATSEEESKIAARKFARSIQNMGYRVRFTNFRVVNVLGTCCFPFGIRITAFSRYHKERASYEPELHPGVTYRIPHPKATLKIFSTGSVTVTAPSVLNVQLAIEHIFPLVYEYRMEDAKVASSEVGQVHMMPKKRPKPKPSGRRFVRQRLDGSDDEESFGSSAEDDFDSDESQD